MKECYAMKLIPTQPHKGNNHTGGEWGNKFFSSRTLFFVIMMTSQLESWLCMNSVHNTRTRQKERRILCWRLLNRAKGTNQEISWIILKRAKIWNLSWKIVLHGLVLFGLILSYIKNGFITTWIISNCWFVNITPFERSKVIRKKKWKNETFPENPKK